MPSDACYVAGYWGDREEAVGACARKFTDFLTAITRKDEILGQWYRKGRSRADATRNIVDLSVDSMTALLLANRNGQGEGALVASRLGFSAAFWNGREATPASVSVTCGATLSPGVMNHFLLEFGPNADGSAPDTCNSPHARQILGLLVDIWDPNWATWSNHTVREAQNSAARQPIVGWITYLDGSRHIPDLSDLAEVSAYKSGSLIEVEDLQDTDSLKQILEIRRRLTEQGGLQPTP